MTVPANLFVATNPSVLGAGGAGLVLNGMLLTSSYRVPIGTVAQFSTQLAVQDFFGGASIEATLAGVYFNGWTGSLQKPGTILFTQYNANAVAAYLKGGNISQLPLATLQSYTGSLTVVVDGYSHVISSISLASYNSFSAAAAGIQSAFTDPTEASFTASLGATFTGSGSGTNLTASGVTGLISVGDVIAGTGITVGTTILSQTSGTTGGAGVYVTSLATTSSGAVTGSSTVLDVTVCASPTIAPGQTLAGSGVTGTPVITSQISGATGGVGLYRISGVAQEVASESMTGVATAPVVTYDSTSGAFWITSGITGTPSTIAYATGTLSALLLLTAATGAVLSQGAAAATPSAFMNALASSYSNWAGFTTTFNPDNSGFANKLLFSQWTNGTNGRFFYTAWDTDPNAATELPATGSFGYALQQDNLSGTVPLWEVGDTYLAAFFLGMVASIAFPQTGGRITTAYKGQTGIVPSVTSMTAFLNLAGNPQVPGLFGNGYNVYSAIGTANADFQNFQRGTISGPFTWADTYINEIWWTNAAQLALITLFTTINSIPINQAGAGILAAALQPQISAGLSFGMYGPGPLAANQIADVNAVAGYNIGTIIQNQGWYLLIQPATPTVVQNRGPWQITFFYNDRGSVQSVNLSTVALI